MTLIALFMSTSFLNPVSTDGFYVVIDKADCADKVIAFDKRKFCLPEEPLVELSDFNDVSELRQVGKLMFFDIHLKPEKVEKIKAGLQVLLELEFAVKLGGEVVGLFKFEHGVGLNKIRFYAYGDDKQIASVYKEIKERLINNEN